MARRHGGLTRTEVIEPVVPASPELPELTPEVIARVENVERGTAFDWTDNSQWSELFDDRSLLVSMPERKWVRDVETMLRQGGQPSSVEQALSLPIRQANLTIEPPKEDKGQTEFVRNVLYSSGQQRGMRPDITQIVAQMTFAIAVMRTYHEVVWEKRPDGRFGYKQVAWRPPATCEMIRDRKSGALRGFRQYVDMETADEIRRAGGAVETARLGDSSFDELGFVRIPANRAVLHLNGQHRDPISGVSDLEVTHWAWRLQQKILLMWATFLDGASMPKIAAYGDSEPDAKANAAAIASLRGSGVIGLQRDASRPDGKVFEVIQHDGKGAGEFRAMIQYLEQQMSHSVLAGFLDLTSNASEGIGSYALSADQKGLFLTSRQAAAKEIANSVTDQLIAPLVRVNFGSDAAVPRLRFEKMSEDQSEKAMDMLQQLGSASNLSVPGSFIDLLIERVGQYLELGDEKIEEMIRDGVRERAAKAELEGRPPEQSGTDKGKLTDTVNVAASLVDQRRQEKQ